MARHKDITFEPGTMGRFVQRHGIRMAIERVPRPLVPAGVMMAPGDRFYDVSLAGFRGSMETIWLSAEPEPPDVEEVMTSLAVEALRYEMSQGDPTTHAQILGYDPDSTWARLAFQEAEADSKGLVDLVGEGGYRGLLEMAEGYFW